MKTKEETITPEIAAEYLKTNWRNRTIRHSHVTRLARDMKAGRWIVTSETIKFDLDGKLIDGQHRLLACTEAGTPFVSWVARNCPEGVQQALGGSVPRKFGDELVMRGFHHCTLLAGASKTCAIYDQFGHWEPQYPRQMTYFDQAEAFANHQQDIISACTFVIDRYHAADTGRRIPPTMLSSLLVQFRKHNAEVGDWFIDKIYSGENMKKGEPVYHLRKLFNPRDGNRRIMHQGLRWAVVIKAYNASCDGVEIGRLAFRAAGPSPENFPRIGDEYWTAREATADDDEDE